MNKLWDFWNNNKAPLRLISEVYLELLLEENKSFFSLSLIIEHCIIKDKNKRKGKEMMPKRSVDIRRRRRKKSIVKRLKSLCYNIKIWQHICWKMAKILPSPWLQITIRNKQTGIPSLQSLLYRTIWLSKVFR